MVTPRSPTAGPSVLIAGAGPTGLVLALWLTELGVETRIIDRAAEPGTTSRALGVQARTLELYRQVGLAGDVITGGVQVAGVNLWAGGERKARLPFRDLGIGLTPFPSLLIYPQDVHERLLIERLRTMGVDVERETELVDLDQDRSGVRVTLRRRDGSEQVCEVAFVAGCDGADSKVRKALGIGFPGGTYSRLFYVADVEASGPSVDHELHVDLEEADFVAVFPLKEQGCVRLVGTIRQEAAADAPALTFDDVSSRVIEHLRLTVAKVNWFSTYHVHHRVAHHFRAGRAFLAGDAAHIHSPVGAQGMNTGIGDAVNLAWKLAAVLQGRASNWLLDTYETERIPFARRLVATTDRAFTIAVKQGAAAKRVRTSIFPRLAPLVVRVPPLRRWIFWTVSQLGVNYRQSPMSAGRAGTVRGGDRLPWVPMSGDEDNFTPLTSLRWQVHVYGEPSPDLAAACDGLGVPLHVFPWDRGASKAGLRRGALYLVRPEGYVSLADPEGSPQRLGDYFAERDLRP
jgi:2-polyprenyl-6-methoxyphenol hydroxylase-like FAD-dependent oxidoreductase